jgi:hypothetical protein
MRLLIPEQLTPPVAHSLKNPYDANSRIVLVQEG